LTKGSVRLTLLAFAVSSASVIAAGVGENFAPETTAASGVQG